MADSEEPRETVSEIEITVSYGDPVRVSMTTALSGDLYDPLHRAEIQDFICQLVKCLPLNSIESEGKKDGRDSQPPR